MQKIVLTLGTYDLFHVGHLNILERAKKLGDKLIVGVSSDKLNLSKKNSLPIIPQHERMKIVKAIHCVDQVFLEESLNLKGHYIEKYNADVLVMGDDWKGTFNGFQKSHGIRVVYLPRTPDISTTELKKKIIQIK